MLSIYGVISPPPMNSALFDDTMRFVCCSLPRGWISFSLISRYLYIWAAHRRKQRRPFILYAVRCRGNMIPVTRRHYAAASRAMMSRFCDTKSRASLGMMLGFGHRDIFIRWRQCVKRFQAMMPRIAAYIGAAGSPDHDIYIDLGSKIILILLLVTLVLAASSERCLVGTSRPATAGNAPRPQPIPQAFTTRSIVAGCMHCYDGYGLQDAI